MDSPIHPPRSESENRLDTCFQTLSPLGEKRQFTMLCKRRDVLNQSGSLIDFKDMESRIYVCGSDRRSLDFINNFYILEFQYFKTLKKGGLFHLPAAFRQYTCSYNARTDTIIKKIIKIIRACFARVLILLLHNYERKRSFVHSFSLVYWLPVR